MMRPLISSNFTRILSSNGFKKDPETTPLEFTYVVSKGRKTNFSEVLTVTEKFYKIRYGHKSLSKDEEKTINEILKKIRKQ